MPRVTQELLDEIVRRIVEAVHPDKIVLFGSHARGDASPDSDLDLLIIAPSDLPRHKRTPPLYKLLAGMGIPKDLVWYTGQEVEQWSHAASYFVTIAMREGRVLYDKAA